MCTRVGKIGFLFSFPPTKLGFRFLMFAKSLTTSKPLPTFSIPSSFLLVIIGFWLFVNYFVVKMVELRGNGGKCVYQSAMLS